MINFVITYQRYVMLFLMGACLLTGFLVLITKNLCKQRKIAIFMLEIGAVFYLGAPILYLTYDGFSGLFFRWVIIISRYSDYVTPLFMLFSFNLYLIDLLSDDENHNHNIPLLLIVTNIILLIGFLMTILSQFFKFYYFIDEFNHYQRGKGRFIATLIPALCMILQISCIFANYKKISQRVRLPIVLFLAIPIFTSILQIPFHGIYITNISIVFMAIVLYVFIVQDSNEEIELSHKREMEILENHKKELEIKVAERTRELSIANEKAENLLLNILPEPIARELTEHPDRTISQKYPNATILFTDIVGFTKMSSEMSAEETVSMLNELVTLFDKRAKEEGIEKIKTIGDAYMAATGLTTNPNNTGALRMLRFAAGLLRDVKQYNEKSSIKLQIRIGINSGNLVAGVIGKSKFIYDVWGDTVNVASRMESTGEPMHIHVSESTFLQTKDKVPYKGPYKVEVKGKGEMNGYFL
ncbi:MAG: hypothetical protein MJ162_05135 [Treponema sp.]|nr:hypothetical protein [Treponema sp.]